MDNNFITSLLTQKVLPSPVECFAHPNKEVISKTIVAFLNGQGGWIVVGVDENHKPTDFNEKETLENIQYEVANNIAPLPLVYIQEVNFDGHTVILITVVKGSLPPYSYKGKYYISVGNSAVMPSPDQISQLLRTSFSVSSQWESVVNLLAGVRNLDQTLMNDIYSDALLEHKISESPDGLFRTLSELQLADSYEVKNGAVCLFGKNINSYLPQSRVRIQLMSRGKSSDSFDNTMILSGNIFTLLKETLHYFHNTLPQQSIFLGKHAKRRDDFIYPMEVLREAMGNALIHRDYSDSVGEITVFIFSNRVEISNPGKLPDKLVKGKNEVMSHISILRNPLMAEIFYIAGYMEKTGRGMELISRKMREIGKKLPEWTSSNNYTTLTIFNEPMKILINERIRTFIDSHSKDETFTKVEYIESFKEKPSKVTAQTDISKMIEMGLCEKIGNGPTTRYRIIDRY